MENLISFLAQALLQTPEKRTPIQISFAPGCTLTVHTPPSVHKIKTEEGYDAFIGQSQVKDVTYGFATVFFSSLIKNEAEKQQLLYLMMQDVYNSFPIQCGTGLTYGYFHPGDPNVFGMTEYWQDRDSMDWKVKGWTNGSVMTVLYIKNIGKVELKDQECFLDGISFSSRKLLQ